MKFLREWFKTYKSKIPHGRRFIVVDPAGSKSKKSDYTVMWAISLDSLGNYYVLDGARDRLNLVQRWETLKNLVIKWNINRVGYEKYGMQSDTEYIREKQRDDGLFFQIVELSGVASKTNRIKKLQPLFQEGRLFFPEALWYDDTEGKRHNLTEEFVRDEYMAFPSPAHDDMLDSLARIRDENLNIIRPKKDDPVPYVKEFDPFRQEKQIKGWMSA